MRSLLAVLALATSCVANGAPNIDRWCNQFPYDPGHLAAWERSAPAVTARIEANDFVGAYQVVIDRFESSPLVSGVQSANLAAVRSAVANYLETVRLTGKEGPQQFAAIPTPPSLSYELQGGDDPLGISISCSVFNPSAPDSIDRTIGYFLRSFVAVGGEGDLAEAMRAAAAVASVAYKSYENLLYNGLAMWPWEMKINDLRMRNAKADTPAPLSQTVFFRPSVSLALLFDGQEKSEADYAFTLEPIGLVRYKAGSDYKKWWGISLLAGITDDNGAGYGAMLRWNNFTLGIARHERSGGDDDNVLYVGVDLYKHILGEQGRTNQARPFLDGLRKKLSPPAQ